MPEKELAFLQDLYIAPDWGERFAALVDEHIKLPAKGRALYVAAGTGSHALALRQKGGEKLQFLLVDESEECLALARVKAATTNETAEFQRDNLTALSSLNDQFDLVLGDASMVASQRLRRMFAEMVRVATPGANVAWWLPTASSFGEFFSIYWEALLRAELEDHFSDVETLITERLSVFDVEALAEQEGLTDVTSWTSIEEFVYESGEQFLNSPLIADFLLMQWLQTLTEPERKRVTHEISQIIDDERHLAEFTLSVKATLVVGTKGSVS